MNEVDKVLYKLGYFDSDPLKHSEVEGYIAEAEEFMKECGVCEDKLNSQRAYAIKSIWADCRDKGEDNNIIRKEGMIIALISQLKR